MNHIINPEDIRDIGRPIGKVENDKLLVYISEAEQMYIKPAIGDALFLDILKVGESNPDYNVLLNGGVYRDECNVIHSFSGLKMALSYFVYAQNTMVGDFQSTRFGTVIKNSDFSTNISSKERSDCYNNALEVAKFYLKECIQFCKYKGFLKNYRSKTVGTGSCTIRKIGN